MTELDQATTAQPHRLRGASVVIGAAAILLALLSPSIAGLIEHIPTHGLTLSDEKLSATRSFDLLFWTYTLLGILAAAFAIAAYLQGGFGRAGRIGLIFGVMALAWKYVLYAFIIMLIVLFLASGIGA